MPTIVIYTSGTLGDHLPYIALGQALTARGHRVRLAINQAMHAYAHRAGLEAIALSDIERGPEEAREHAWAWDHWRNPDIAAHPNAPPFEVDQYITQVRELIDLCQEADLFISTSIRPQGYTAQAALDLPWLTVSMNPYAFWQPIHPAEREAWRKARVEEYNRLKEVIAYTWAELGVNKTVPPWSNGWLFARHILLAGSPHFSLPNLNQFQPRSSLDLTGFWFYQDPDWQEWQPDEDLRRFCQRRPLVLAFSSQPLENPRESLLLYPVNNQNPWSELSPEVQSRIAQTAYAIHH